MMLVMTVAVTRNQLVAFINIDDGGGNLRLLVMQLLRVIKNLVISTQDDKVALLAFYVVVVSRRIVLR